MNSVFVLAALTVLLLCIVIPLLTILYLKWCERRPPSDRHPFSSQFAEDYEKRKK